MSPHLLISALLVSMGLAQQHQYKLLTENLTLIYTDHKWIDMTVGIFKRNNMNAINVTVRTKDDVPETTMAAAQSWKWLGNDYRVPTLQIRKSVKDVLEMESFDLQSLWVHHAKPPLVWPIQKLITYRLEGWIPDSTKYPPNLPDGKWKTEVTLHFSNKTKIAVVLWYFTIEYHK